MWNSVNMAIKTSVDAAARAMKTGVDGTRAQLLNSPTSSSSSSNSGDVTFSSTDEARNCCSTLDAGVTYYNNLVSELKNARTKISTNWEGDATAITDVLTRIDQVTATFEASLIPAMSGLSSSIMSFADEIDKVSNNTVDSSTTTTPVQNPSNGGSSTATTTSPTTTAKEEKPGFWEYHGKNFAEAWTGQTWAADWDYSGCDSGLDYVGAFVDNLFSEAGNVVDGVVDTAGAAVNVVVDGISEFLGWLFG